MLIDSESGCPIVSAVTIDAVLETGHHIHCYADGLVGSCSITAFPRGNEAAILREKKTPFTLQFTFAYEIPLKWR